MEVSPWENHGINMEDVPLPWLITRGFKWWLPETTAGGKWGMDHSAMDLTWSDSTPESTPQKKKLRSRAPPQRSKAKVSENLRSLQPENCLQPGVQPWQPSGPTFPCCGSEWSYWVNSMRWLSWHTTDPSRMYSWGSRIPTLKILKAFFAVHLFNSTINGWIAGKNKVRVCQHMHSKSCKSFQSFGNSVNARSVRATPQAQNGFRPKLTPKICVSCIVLPNWCA